mgnify:CR=1 FL=1
MEPEKGIENLPSQIRTRDLQLSHVEPEKGIEKEALESLREHLEKVEPEKGIENVRSPCSGSRSALAGGTRERD